MVIRKHVGSFVWTFASSSMMLLGFGKLMVAFLFLLTFKGRNALRENNLRADDCAY